MQQRQQFQIVIAVTVVGFLALAALLVQRTRSEGESDPQETRTGATMPPTETARVSHELRERAAKAEALLESARKRADALEARLREAAEESAQATTDAELANQESRLLREQFEAAQKESGDDPALIAAKQTLQAARKGTHELAKACVLQMRRSYDRMRKHYGKKGLEKQLAMERARATAYSWCASLSARLHEEIGGGQTTEVDVIEQARKARVAYEKLTEDK